MLPRLEMELAQWEGALSAEEEAKEKSDDADGGGGGMLGEQVTAAHIAEVVSRATGIPADRLMAAEKEKLLTMESALAQQVRVGRWGQEGQEGEGVD